MRYTTLHENGTRLAAHRHALAYLAIVETGSFTELSTDGVYDCTGRMAIIHPAWHLHSDCFAQGKAQVANFDLSDNPTFGVFALTAAAWRATRQAKASSDALDIVLNDGQRLEARPHPASVQHMWEKLSTAPRQSITQLARELKVTPEHAARLFRRHTGFSPRAFRSAKRLERAVAALNTGRPAADIAQDLGFSDQPHLCRAIKQATGKTAGQLSCP